MADASYGAKQAPSPDVQFATDLKAGKHTPYHKDEDRAALVAAIAAATANLGLQTTLASIDATLKAQADIAVSIWTDNSGAFYVRRDVIDQDSGTVTVTFTNPTGTAATPGVGLRPASNEESLQTETIRYVSNVSGTGHTAGDMLERVVVLDANASPPTVVSSVWVNLTTGAVMATPPNTANLTANPTALPANAASETTSAAILAKLPASPATSTLQSSLNTLVGTQSALSWTTGDGSLISILKAAVDELRAAPSSVPQTQVDHTKRTRTAVSISGADTDAVLAQDADERHVITGCILFASADGNLTFTNSGGNITIPVVANRAIVLDDYAAGWFVTDVNQAFSITKSAAMTVTGAIYSAKVS